MPNYNFPIQILRTSTSICWNNTYHDLVIVVKSPIYSLETRMSFRDFMRRERSRNPNLKVGVVFSMGLPRRQGGRIFNRDGHTRFLAGPAGDMLQKYAGKGDELLAKVKEEIEKFDDIILADYEDTYYNLTWKTVTNLRWMSAFCNKTHGDVFMIIDDDHRVNISTLAEYLISIPKAAKREAIFGRIAKADGAYRSPRSKLFLSYREMPWLRMCPYPHGFSQLIGADIIDKLAIASAYTRYNYMHEDVYLGLLAFKLGIQQRLVDGMYDHEEYPRRRRNNSMVIVALKKYMEQ